MLRLDNEVCICYDSPQTTNVKTLPPPFGYVHFSLMVVVVDLSIGLAPVCVLENVWRGRSWSLEPGSGSLKVMLAQKENTWSG
jgi:hypothetical protein